IANITTLSDFFSFDLAKKISKNSCFTSMGNNPNGIRPAKIITCNNMFAHTKDLTDVVKGVLELLDDGGVFIFENSYLLDILNNQLFDTIYHEHCHTHSITPLVKFFKRLGMKIF